MEGKLISFKLNPTEYEALKKLARNEVRSMSGWLKYRIIEAIRSGLLSMEETNQNKPAHSMEKKFEDREEPTHADTK